MSNKSAVMSMMDSIKASVMAVLTTIGVSFSTVMEYVPTDIGKFGTLVGMILSIVLIWRHNNLRKLEDQKRETEKLTQDKLRLEVELLSKKLEGDDDV